MLALDGIDPVEAKQRRKSEAFERRALTFRTLSEDFVVAPENKNRAERTISDRNWMLKKHLLPRLESKVITEITSAEIRQCLRDIQSQTSRATGPVAKVDEKKRGNRTANHCHEFLKVIFGWAVEEERIESNPAGFRKMFDDKAAKRAEMPERSLRLIWEALERQKETGLEEATAIALQLHFVTLQRPNEIAKAQREDLDLDNAVWRIPESRNKTGVVYTVPLSELAVKLFTRACELSECEWVFPRPDKRRHIASNTLSKRFGKLRDRLEDGGHKLGDVTLYDGRRLGRTRLEERLGFQSDIAEQVISHGSKGGFSQHYNVADRMKKVAKAHEAWTAELLRIIDRQEAAGNVISIRQKAEMQS